MNENEMTQVFREFILKHNSLPGMHETMVHFIEMQKLYEIAYDEGFNAGFEAGKNDPQRAS